MSWRERLTGLRSVAERILQEDVKPHQKDRGGEAVLTVPISAERSKWVFFSFVLLLVAVIVRALYLQCFNTEFLQKKGEERYARTLVVPAQRGQIKDRNGTVLASSISVSEIVAIPPQTLKASSEQIEQLAFLIGVPKQSIEEKLESRKDKTYVSLAHHIDNDLAKKVLELKIPGVYTDSESMRHYPDGERSAHIVGYTDKEEHGQEGVELSNDGILSGVKGERYVIRDRLGRIVEDQWLKQTSVGSDIILSIDSRLQYIAHKALRKAVLDTGAKAGAVLVADVKTGEILAMNNWPTFDPNNRKYLQMENVRNRAITDQFEPGSTMKPFSIAKALDLGIVNPETRVQTGPGKIVIADRLITDTHNYGEISVSQVVSKSSNIGTVKIALEIDNEELWNTFRALGFGQQPKIGFRGAASGVLRHSAFYNTVEKATMSYGYGLSVSLLQLVRAYTSLARNGDVIDLTLKKTSREAKGVQVFSPNVARQMRTMMAETVQAGGTATRVSVQGYTIAGKTGTANKIKNGAYVDKMAYASFVGMAPASQPRLIVAVLIDEPSKGSYFGGTVAAPVFNEVTANALQLMGVHPDDKHFVSGSGIAVKSLNNR